MCCFARSVESVSDTEIFARLSGQSNQYLAYQMQYQSKTLNAMILPIPVALPAGEEDVRFIDLKGYERFFRDLDRGFPYPPPPAFSNPPPTSRGPVSGAVELKVHDVGDCVASFVPSLDDFERLNSQFVIPRDVWKKIPAYDDYGFAVFQLKSLAGKVHPMAFEFKTRFPDQVFFPTVHIHDGEVHDLEHFDHKLYLQNPVWDKVVGEYRGPLTPDPSTGFIRSKTRAGEVCKLQLSAGLLAGDQLLHRKVMVGNLPNRDVMVATTAMRKQGENGPKRVLPIASGFAGAGIAAAISWLIARRIKLKVSRVKPSEPVQP